MTQPISWFSEVIECLNHYYVDTKSLLALLAEQQN